MATGYAFKEFIITTHFYKRVLNGEDFRHVAADSGITTKDHAYNNLLEVAQSNLYRRVMEVPGELNIDKIVDQLMQIQKDKHLSFDMISFAQMSDIIRAQVNAIREVAIKKII